MKIGDTIKYGFYPQNNEHDELIEWVVIRKTRDEALLLSKYALDCKPFGKFKIPEITYFLENAFRKRTKVREYPFLLSVEHLQKINKSILICEATQYAKKQGVWTPSFESDACLWWTSSRGDWYPTAKIINTLGNVDEVAISFESDCIGVRPAIWVDVEFSNFEKYFPKKIYRIDIDINKKYKLCKIGEEYMH